MVRQHDMKQSTEQQNTNQKPDKKNPLRSILTFLLFFAGCLLVGYLLGEMIGRGSIASSNLPGNFDLLVQLVVFFLALFVQIILHEVGHLVFGLLTGYRFLSFRVGSLMLIKEDGHLRLKTLSIAGTGGQCLLLPPAWREPGFPFVLYHLGGSIMNLITAGIFYLLATVFSEYALVNTIFLALSLNGLIIGLGNGIPMRFSLLDNDGRNVLTLKKDPQALFASYRMLEIHGNTARGKRLKDMPDEWFVLPEQANLQNPMVTTIEVYAISRLMDEHRLDLAAERMRALLRSGAALHAIHRNMLRIDLAFCTLMQDDVASAQSELDAPLRKFMQSMKNYPSVLRTQYAKAVLITRDAEKAEQILDRFDRAARKFPYPSEIEAERELILAIRQKSMQSEPDANEITR